MGKHSEITAEGDAIFAKEHVKELFDDFAEIQCGLTTIFVYFGVAQKQKILNLKNELDVTIRNFLSGKQIGPGPLGLLPRAYDEVSECARQDLLS
jgi:hypothetical protein